jgi:hypothetical protein
MEIKNTVPENDGCLGLHYDNLSTANDRMIMKNAEGDIAGPKDTIPAIS